jgi:hypothetical protein
VVEDELQPIPSAVKRAEEIIQDADLSDETLEAAANRLDELKRETGLLEINANRQSVKEAAEQLDIDVPVGASTESMITKINEEAPSRMQDYSKQDDTKEMTYGDLVRASRRYF